MLWQTTGTISSEHQAPFPNMVKGLITILKNDNWSTEHTSISAYWELKHSGSILNLKWWIIQELKHIELL